MATWKLATKFSWFKISPDQVEKLKSKLLVVKSLQADKLIIQNIFTFLDVSFLSSFFIQHKQVHDASVTVDGENSWTSFPEVVSHILNLPSTETNAK